MRLGDLIEKITKITGIKWIVKKYGVMIVDATNEKTKQTK